jgi:hypothetical protein
VVFAVGVAVVVPPEVETEPMLLSIEAEVAEPVIVQSSSTVAPLGMSVWDAVRVQVGGAGS